MPREQARFCLKVSISAGCFEKTYKVNEKIYVTLCTLLKVKKEGENTFSETVDESCTKK